MNKKLLVYLKSPDTKVYETIRAQINFINWGVTFTTKEGITLHIPWTSIYFIEEVSS